MENFLPPVMFFGAINSLAQVLLKLTCPGIPDIYQGTELWNFSLVDPDNRRPVDFGLRRRLLAELLTRAEQGDLAALCDELVREYRDGRVKLWTTLRTLRFRREHRQLFQTGRYVRLDAELDKQEHVFAFAREQEWEMAVVVVPRFAYTLMKGEVQPPLATAWGEAQVALPPHAPNEFVNEFTGEIVRKTATGALLCREVFARFPVALLRGR
jgi:(1->4)-alpha-D-glucan 1-alpha-D-glucosylmutase